jgi:hypothetical protein
MTRQKWGSKQVLEKRKTSLSLMEVYYLTTHTSLSPIRREFAPSFVNYKKGALDSQPQKSLPVASPWSVVLSEYSGFFHH